MEKQTYEQLDRIETLLNELVIITRERDKPIYVKLKQQEKEESE